MNPSVKVGDRIRITGMVDPFSPESYVGREGIVQHIDDAGQLHGTWGGLAILPDLDTFILL